MIARRVITCTLAALLTAALPVFALEGHGGASAATKLAAWAGRLHPIAVHFPIALLIVGALAEWFTAGRSAARLMVRVGALVAVVAAMLGWLHAAHIRILPGTEEGLFLHRWTGTALAALSVLCAAASFSVRPAAVHVYRFTLLACAGLVVLVGHAGGELVYGEDYFSW